MTGFWIAGIAINVAGLAALVWWAARNWRRDADPDARQDPHDPRTPQDPRAPR